MKKDDQNPGLEGSGEHLEELELSPVTEEDSEGEGEGGDPLDDIQDPKARAEAKKNRAIVRRSEKETKPEPKPEDAPKSEQEFLTKSDYYRSNEKKAIRSATLEKGVVNEKGEVILAPEEVKANWDKIVPFYTPRRGKETTEDISEDIRDAVILFTARNTVTEKDDSADQLKTNAVLKSGGGPTQGKTPKPTDPPNFKLPTKPTEWYSKKS